MEHSDKFYVQSVHRALGLVDAIAKEDKAGVTLTELAAKTQLPPSTAYRLLENLKAWQYVSQDADGRYYLGLELTLLGKLVRRGNRLDDAARPILMRLSEETGQTIYLGMLDLAARDVVYADKIEGKGNIRLASKIGTRNLLHSTANGKILMGDFDRTTILSLLSATGMPALTDKTITDPEEYLAQVEEARRLGYAFDLEENEKNIICVSAPIRDRRGCIIAAVSVSGVQGITMTGHPEQFVENVLSAARDISEKLGYKPA